MLHPRLDWFFPVNCVFRSCVSVSLVGVFVGYSLIGEHSSGGPADSASSHLISVLLWLKFSVRNHDQEESSGGRAPHTERQCSMAIRYNRDH